MLCTSKWASISMQKRKRGEGRGIENHEIHMGFFLNTVFPPPPGTGVQTVFKKKKKKKKKKKEGNHRGMLGMERGFSARASNTLFLKRYIY